MYHMCKHMQTRSKDTIGNATSSKITFSFVTKHPKKTKQDLRQIEQSVGASARDGSSSCLGEYALAKGGPWRRVYMESPPNLGLGTINIASSMERLVITRACVWSLGMGMGRC